MKKIVYADNKGRLSFDPKGQFLMVGVQNDFEVNLLQGIIFHKKYTFTWKTPKITDWQPFLDEISRAESVSMVLEGSNVAKGVENRKGGAFASVLNDIVIGSVHLDRAPHDTTNFPYKSWKNEIIRALKSENTEVWLGTFDGIVFIKNMKV